MTALYHQGKMDLRQGHYLKRKKKFCYLKIIKIKEFNWLNLLLRPVCQSQGEQPSLRNISPDKVQNCTTKSETHSKTDGVLDFLNFAFI